MADEEISNATEIEDGPHDSARGSRGSDRDDDTDVMTLLRILAETQRDLVRSRGGEGKANKVRVLSNIRIPEFDGGINTSVRKYREWRKRVEIIQHLNDLKKTELAMLM